MTRRWLVRGLVRRWLRGYFLAGALLFTVSALVGFLLGTQVPTEWLQGEAGTSPFVPMELTFVAILRNNLLAITVTLFGAVSLGLLSAAVLVVNGLILGAVVQIALRVTSALTVFVLVAPHGIIEIPAILIVAAIGLRFGHRTIRYVRGREEELVTWREIREAGILYAVAVLLIVVAAWIEAEVTLRLAEQIAT